MATEVTLNDELEDVSRPCQLITLCCRVLPGPFHPYGLIRLCWDTFIMICLIFTAIEIPLTVSFDLELSLNNTLGILAFSTDIILLLDVGLNFRTSYYDKWDHLLLHTDPIDIAKKYLKGWFLLDFTTSFPMEFIMDKDGTNSNQFATYIKVLRVFRLLRIFKILRVLRVMKIFDGITNTVITREVFFVLKLLKIMGGMVLTAHYFACIWWYVGIQYYKEEIPVQINDNDVTIYSSWIQAKGIEEDDPLFIKYSASWYWAIVTLFTTGYGDITAHNTTEEWVCSICILAGSCFFAYFIGTLTTWVSEGDRVRAHEIQKVEEAQAFCRHYKFDREFTRTVLTHVRYYCNYNFVFDPDDIITTLPSFLQKEVNAKIAKKYISDLDLFKDLPDEVIGEIALTLHSVSCNAGRALYRRGDIAKSMYLQRTGEAKLKYLDGTQSRILRRGDVVGERSLISGKRRYDVVCLIWTEFFVLNISAIRQVFLENFKPKRFKYEWNKIRKMVKDASSKSSKTIRKCNLAHTKEEVSRQTVHELSTRGSTMRSQLIEKIAFTPRKKKCGEQYIPIQTNTSEDSSIVPHYSSSFALDLDDSTMYNIPNIANNVELKRRYNSEFIDIKEEKEDNRKHEGEHGSRQSTEIIVKKPIFKDVKSSPINMNTTNSKQNLPKLEAKGSSGRKKFLIRMSPFIARHDSLQRNERVLHHTNTIQPKVWLSTGYKEDDLSDTDEFDLDDVTDTTDEDTNAYLLDALSSKQKVTMSSNTGKRMGGKFGGQKKNKNVIKTKRKSAVVAAAKLGNNVTINNDTNDYIYNNSNDGQHNDLDIYGKHRKSKFLLFNGNEDAIKQDTVNQSMAVNNDKIQELMNITGQIFHLSHDDDTGSSRDLETNVLEQDIQKNKIIKCEDNKHNEEIELVLNNNSNDNINGVQNTGNIT